MIRLPAGKDYDGRFWYVDVTTLDDLSGGPDHMLTTCGCIANKDQTEIITACVLHELWYLKREQAALEKLGALLNDGEHTAREALTQAASQKKPC